MPNKLEKYFYHNKGRLIYKWVHWARIIGVDLEPRCKELEEKQIEIFIGDQSDRSFLRTLRGPVGPIDIIIDDGGHTVKQQTTTFREMWPALKDGGGYQKLETFIEFGKRLIDQMRAWHAQKSDRKRLKVDAYTRSIAAMHIYSSVIVFDKAKIVRPYDEQHGKPSDIEFSFLG